MSTGKAVIAGLVVTIGLLVASYGFEGIAQLAGPEEVEVKSGESDDHDVESDDHEDEG